MTTGFALRLFASDFVARPNVSILDPSLNLLVSLFE